MESKMFELAERLKSLKGEKHDLEAQVKDCAGEIDAAERALVALMLESETQNFTRNSTMYCLSTRTRASAVAGRKEELFDALRAEGFGDMIVEQVNANTLSSFVKEQRSENGDELPGWLEGLVSVFDQPGVSVRKSAK
jgi:ATP/maltotriose-dependent transcriptional regulator MalT